MDSDSSSDDSSSSDDDDDDELLLLMHAVRCKKLMSLTFDRGWTARGGQHIVSLNQIPPDPHWQRRFLRFEVKEISKIMRLYHWPADGVLRYKTHTYGFLECLLAVMMRFAGARTLFTMSAFFGRREQRLSDMTNAMVTHLYNTYGYQVQNLHLWTFLAQQTADAFAAKDFPYSHCFGLLDGKLYSTCRPTDPALENAAFSGYYVVNQHTHYTCAVFIMQIESSNETAT